MAWGQKPLFSPFMVVPSTEAAFVAAFLAINIFLAVSGRPRFMPRAGLLMLMIRIAHKKHYRAFIYEPPKKRDVERTGRRRRKYQSIHLKKRE